MEELNTTQNEENVEAINVTANNETTGTPEAPLTEEQLKEMSCAELIDRMAILSQNEILPNRKDIEAIKNAFFRKKEFYAQKNTPEQEQLFEEAEIQEDRLNDIYSSFKSKYKIFREQQEKEQEENYEKRKLVLERFKSLIDSNEDFEFIRTQYLELLAEWKSIGFVPEAKYTEIQNEYGYLTERFYSLKKMNDDFRSLHFKKNLDAKKLLIEEAKSLSESDDVINSTKKLQDLHKEWKEIGPVDYELRDQIWDEFNEFSKKIHTKRQAHFENKKEQEEANLIQKKEICEKIEAIDYSKLSTVPQWNQMKTLLIELQAKWKSIGFVTKEQNEEIYQRYRAACNFFFENREKFFKKRNEQLDETIKRREDIVLKAEELSLSTDWDVTKKAIVKLQKEWKEAGFAPHKIQQQLWERFQTACNNFFNAMKEKNADKTSEMLENLKKKEELIIKAKELLNQADNLSSEELINQVRVLSKEFNRIGFVPFKNKDKIISEFQKTVDKIYQKSNYSKGQEKLEQFESYIQKFVDEKDKKSIRDSITSMSRFVKKAEEEIDIRDRNMGIFSSDSKWGDSMMKGLDSKQERLRNDVELVKEKIALAKQKLSEMRETEEA